MSSLVATLSAALPRPDGQRILTLAALKAWVGRLPDTLDRLPASRFAGWRAAPAALLLAALAGLTLWGLVLAARPDAAAFVAAPDPNNTDAVLYETIARRVAAGDSYYDAVVAEHRARSYPLRPIMTVRLPTLATVQATLGPTGAAALLAALSLLAWGLLVRRMAAVGLPASLLTAAAVLALFGLAPGLVPVGAVWHEAWAVTFVALSLACRSRERWWGSVAFGLAAVAFRELAVPYLCVMAFAALVEGNRREASAWLAAILLFAGALALHAVTLAGLVRPDDLASQGWMRASGWPLILSMLSNSTSFAVFPVTLVSCLAILALLGWSAWPGAFGLRGALLMLGYVCAFMVIGRKDNVYWGLLWGPLLPVGLVFAAPALRDLVRAVRPKPAG